MYFFCNCQFLVGEHPYTYVALELGKVEFLWNGKKYSHEGSFFLWATMEHVFPDK